MNSSLHLHDHNMISCCAHGWNQTPVDYSWKRGEKLASKHRGKMIPLEDPEDEDHVQVFRLESNWFLNLSYIIIFTSVSVTSSSGLEDEYRVKILTFQGQ